MKTIYQLQIESRPRKEMFRSVPTLITEKYFTSATSAEIYSDEFINIKLNKRDIIEDVTLEDIRQIITTDKLYYISINPKALIDGV